MYKKNRTKIIIGAFTGLGAIILITLIYAAFTGQLNITGTAVNRKSNWNIHFENLSGVTSTGSAKALTQPRIASQTSIEDYSVSLTSPGDTISFTFKVVNEGNYNASISGISIGTPECSGTDSTSNSNVCSKLTYTLSYDNGASVQTGDTLMAKDYVTMKVTLTYAEFNDSSLLPTEDVSISNLGITINYTQSGSAEVDNSGVVQNNRVYHIGDKITLNNEDYWVIKTSGAGQDYVVALKDQPLTVSEVNLYGGVGTENNHVNRYTQSSVGTAGNLGGYGGVAYYSSETCGCVNGSFVFNECTNGYNESDIKHIVDNWALSKFSNNELKINDGYEARLIKDEEYTNLSSSNWNHGNYKYWTMTVGSFITQVLFVYDDGNIYNGAPYNYVGVTSNSFSVRPVINVKKSVISS